MASFRYKAKNARGEVVSGTVVGTSKEEATQKLKRKALVVVKIKEQGQKSVRVGKHVKPGVRKGELELFTRQLSTMISAGIPLLECL